MAKVKLKSKSGAGKRFIKSAGGWKCKQSHARHILTKKSTKRKRQLRGVNLVNPSDVGHVNQMLPHA